jgi:hypothetical protein
MRILERASANWLQRAVQQEENSVDWWSMISQTCPPDLRDPAKLRS